MQPHRFAPSPRAVHRRPGWVLTAGALGVALLAGCTTDPAPAEPAAISATGSQLAEPSGPNDVGAEHPSPLPYPTDDAASAAAALQTATDAMTAFAQPGADPDSWWDQLAPLLTATAQAAYAGTDPAQIPASAVTGPPVATDSPSTYLATVEVPTNIGAYRVLLVRAGAGAPWLVERLTPPPGLPSS